MNSLAEVCFRQQPIKFTTNNTVGIEKVCINDICLVLKRNLFLKDGTAIHRCPSATILDESHPRELYADFEEVLKFIEWMCAESKILAPSGRKLMELLHGARLESAAASEPAIDPPVQTQEQEIMELEYSGNKFTMKMHDGRYMVNATEMARPFDKRPNVWLKMVEAVKLRQVLVDDGVCRNLDSQIITTRGPHGATWLEIHLWVHFAQWLSPAFASWCSKKIVPLMKNGHVNFTDESVNDTGARSSRPPHYDDSDFAEESFLPVPENYETALAVIENQKDTILKQREFIRHNKHKFEYYDQTVESREWFTTTMIAHEIGISAVKLNIFLMDENIQVKNDGVWSIKREYRHLRDYHFYEWYNYKTKYLNKYKIDSWTPEGREYIIELWKKVNG